MDNAQDFAAQKAAREAAERASMLRDARGMLDQDEAALTAPPAPEAAPTTSTWSPTYGAGEVFRATVGGLRDGAHEIFGAIDEAAVWLNNNVIDLRVGDRSKPMEVGEHRVNLPETAKNTSTGGQIGRHIVQFVGPFIGALKAISATRGLAVSKAARAGEAVVASAATSATALDPDEDRLSNLILDWTDEDPVVGSAVLQYLAAKDGDSRAEGRLKNVLENALLDTAVAGVAALGFRGYKRLMNLKGKEPAKVVEEAATARKTAAQEQAEAVHNRLAESRAAQAKAATEKYAKEQAEAVRARLHALNSYLDFEPDVEPEMMGSLLKDVPALLKDAPEEAAQAAKALDDELAKRAEPTAPDADEIPEVAAIEARTASTEAAEAQAARLIDEVFEATASGPAEREAKERTLSTLNRVRRALASRLAELRAVFTDGADPVAAREGLEPVFRHDSEMEDFWLKVAGEPSLLPRIDLTVAEDAAEKAAREAVEDSAGPALRDSEVNIPRGDPLEVPPPVRAALDESAQSAREAAEATAKRGPNASAPKLSPPAREAIEAALERTGLIAPKAADEALSEAAQAGDAAVAGGAKKAAKGKAAKKAAAQAPQRGLEIDIVGGNPAPTAARAAPSPAAQAATTALQKDLLENALATPEEIRKAVVDGAEAMARGLVDSGAGEGLPAGLKKGDTVFFGGGQSGVVTNVAKNGSLIIKEDASGGIRVLKPDDVDSVQSLGNIYKGQAGQASPILLSRLASGILGGLGGFEASDPEAPLADRLMLAGLTAAAAAAGGGRAAKLLTAAKQTKAVQKAASPTKLEQAAPVEDVAATRLRDPKLQGINTTKIPVGRIKIPMERVDQFIAAAKSGDVQKLAASLDESDFNLANIDTDDEAKEVIDAFSKILEKEIDKVTGGVRHHDQVAKLAHETGAGVKSLEDLYAGVKNLDTRILAHRTLLVASANKVRDLAQYARAGGSLEVLAARKQIMVHSVIQAQMKGVQTEVARALSAMRIRARGADYVMNEVNSVLDALGGAGPSKKLMERLALIESPAAFNRAARKTPVQLSYNIVHELFVNNILWGPATQAVNVAGGILHGVLNPTVRVGAALIGAARRDPNRIPLGEAGHLMVGFVGGIVDSFRINAAARGALKSAAGKAVKGDFRGAKETLQGAGDNFGSTLRAFGTGKPSERPVGASTNEQVLRTPALSSEALNIPPDTALAHGVDTLGALLRVPTERMIGPIDELFWAANYRAELNALAYRQATTEGLAGTEAKKRMAEILENPDDVMAQAAAEAGRAGTFTSRLDGRLRALGHVVTAPGLNLVVPFFRNPTNLIRYNLEHTPVLGALTKAWREDFMAGGIRRDTALAKWGTGAMLTTAGMLLAANGSSTPGFGKRRGAEDISGQLEYSFYIDGKYYQHKRLDPTVAWFFGITADLHMLSQSGISESEMEKLHLSVVSAISQYTLNKAALSTLSDVVAAASDPEKEGYKWEQVYENIASGLIPGSAAFRTAKNEVDPVMREVSGMVEAAKAISPWHSDSLAAKIDVFGEKRVRGEALGPDWGSPIKFSKDSTDPAAAFLGSLDIDLQRPQRTVGRVKGGPSIELTPKQYERLQILAGKEVKLGGLSFKERVAQIAEKYPAAESRPDGYTTRAEQEVRAAHEAYKEAALHKLAKEVPEVAAALQINRRNAFDALRGRATRELPALLDQ